jgi:hypothetical protein
MTAVDIPSILTGPRNTRGANNIPAAGSVVLPPAWISRPGGPGPWEK